MIAEPWEFVLLALAAFRVWKLVADDVIFEALRDRSLARLDGRPALAASIEDFLSCPYCLGFWITVAWWGAWLIWPYETVVVAVPWALSAVVGIVVTLLPD